MYLVLTRLFPQRQAFFSVRIFLAIICSFCEAKFYRTIVETMNDRVGRYTLFMLIFSAGMWNASTGKSVVFDMKFAA